MSKCQDLLKKTARDFEAEEGINLANNRRKLPDSSTLGQLVIERFDEEYTPIDVIEASFMPNNVSPRYAECQDIPHSSPQREVFNRLMGWAN